MTRVTTILGLLAWCGMLVLHYWFPRFDMSPHEDTYSVEIGGRNAFYQLCDRRFGTVRRNFTSLTTALLRLDERAVLCIVGASRSPTEAEWTAIAEWVARGGRLIYAAPLEEPGDECAAFELTIHGPGSSQSGTKAARQSNLLQRAKLDERPVTTKLAEGDRVRWKTRGKISVRSSRAKTVVEQKESLQGVRVAHGVGVAIILASDYIFSNESLADSRSDNAPLAFHLVESLRESDDVLWFDESLNVTGHPRVVGIVLHDIIRPVTLQAVLLLLLFAWQGRTPFGPTLAPVLNPRRDIAAHTDALGTQYYRVENGVEVFRAYATMFCSEFRLRVDGPAVVAGKRGRYTETSPDVLRLAARSGLAAAHVAEILDQMEQARAAKNLSRTATAQLIRRLGELRSHLLAKHGRRPS